jgi:ribonuclease/clavin/mitogillin
MEYIPICIHAPDPILNLGSRSARIRVFYPEACLLFGCQEYFSATLWFSDQLTIIRDEIILYDIISSPPPGGLARGRQAAKGVKILQTMSMTIVNVGYRSTNYWVISAGTSRLLVDLGWPGSMGMMRASLERKDVPIEEIQYGLATHYHIDHAGVAQELKLAGVPLLVLDVQVSAIPLMKSWTKPQDHYLEVTMDDNVVIACDESRSLLENIGISGEIFHTPGHSDDSVSLLLDDGSVFTGDLTAPQFIGLENPAIVKESWRLLRARGAQRVYPGHGPVRPIADYSIA